MTLRLFFTFTLFVTISGVACAQKNQEKTQAPNSLEPVYPKKDYTPKKKKKKAPVSYDARNEFYDRMEKNWEEREKREKNIGAVDKSQPPYFGHKHPPKKHPASKMKYCKICGIRH